MLDLFLSNLWKWKCGLPEKDQPKIGNIESFDSINETQNTDEFKELHQLAHNRMIMGRFRYGDIHRQNLDNYDTVKEAHRRLDLYSNTHNLEHLVDVYNMVKIEYFKGKKAGKKLQSIDDGVHAEEIKK